MKVTVGPTSNIVFQPATDRGTSAKINFSAGGSGPATEAYRQANDAYLQANTAGTNALNAYGQANNAYAAANNRVLKSGDTMTGQLNISSGGLLVTGNSNFDSGTLFVDAVNDRVGIGTTSPSYKLEVNGSFAATTKSFVIDHPTKPGKKLRYGSLEGPENGVYVRGKLTGTNTIELPDHWTGLVHEDSITVNLTPIGGKHQNLYVKSIGDNKVIIGSCRDINCFYTVFAERKDVEKLIVEY